MLSLVTAVIKPAMLEAVKDALKVVQVHGLTATEVKGFGQQGGHTEMYRGAPYTIDFVPKVKIEVLVGADEAEGVANAIRASANTGAIGDGKVWVVPVSHAIRIRTGETGLDAV